VLNVNLKNYLLFSAKTSGRFIFSFFLSIAFLASKGITFLKAQELPEETFTLRDSIQRSLQNNPAVLSADEDIKVAQGKIQEAASLLYPKVDFNFNATKHRTESIFVLPEDLGLTVLEPPSGTIVPKATVEDLYTGQVGLRQYLFTGGRVSSTLKLAKANLKTSKTHLDAAKKDVILSVTVSFYDALLKKLVLSLYDKDYRELSSLLEKFTQGKSMKLLLEQEVSRLRMLASNQRQALEEAQLKYLHTVGLELFKRIELKGELKPEPVHMELDNLLAWAVEGRPELQETRTEEEVNQLSIDLSLAQRNPTVAFGAGYEVRDSNLALKTNNWNATVNLNLPLFDGFSTLSRIRQSRYQAELGRVKKAKLQDQVQLEVREAYQECLHWQEELKTREEEVNRLLNLSSSYARNSVPLNEWLQFRSWFLDTQIHHHEAIYQQLVARAKLERAIGHQLPE